MNKHGYILFLALVVAACGDNNDVAGTPGGNCPVDAGASDDGTSVDAAVADAALPDAAVADAALPDAAVADAAPPDAPPPEIFVFWAESSGGTIGRANVDGSEAGDIISGLSTPFCVVVDPDEDKIYYTGGTAAITKADLDGSNPVDIVADGESPFGMAIDTVNGKLYWSEFANGRILRADLDGSNVEAIISEGLLSPSGIWVDPEAGKLYVISYNQTRLQRANLDGTALETIADSLPGQGVDVIVDPATETLYYSQRDAELRTMDLDGSNPGTFISGQGIVQGLAIDFVAGKLYWSTAGTIRRADLADGGNIEDIADTGGNAWGISLLPTPAP